MAPFSGVPTPEQQVALAVAPKVTGALSILGSSYIIVDAAKRLRRASSKNHTYHRLLIGLSVCDLLMTLGLFTSTWFMPSSTPNVWGAVGTTQTCEAVGFFEQAGLAAVLYNASLSTYYLLRIRFNWTPQRLVKAEYVLHGVPLLFGISTMIACLALDLFNSGLFDCWIAPYPQGCEESWRSPTGETTCIRGNNASLYVWVFDVIPKWLAVLLVTVNMVVTHRGVYRQERKTLRYTDPSRSMERWSSALPAPESDSSWRRRESSKPSTDREEDGAERLDAVETPSAPSTRAAVAASRPTPMRLPVSRRLARQSYLYVGALYLTYITVVVTRATELALGYVYYEMLLTISITIPLQGFWNVLVYLRPRYLRERDRRRKLQKTSEQRRAQREAGASHPPVNDTSPPENQSTCGTKCSSCFFRWRVTAAVQEQLSTVSQVVREGGLDDEEEDFDNETGYSADDEVDGSDVDDQRDPIES